MSGHWDTAAAVVLHILCDHQLLIRALSLPAGLLIAVPIATHALRAAPGHRAPRGHIRSRPGEVRRHATATGTRPPSATRHVLAGRGEHLRPAHHVGRHTHTRTGGTR